MTDDTAPAPRGEAAWRANLDRVQARNEEARKAGRLARKEEDKRVAAKEALADRRERDEMSSLSQGAAGSGKAYLRGSR